MFETPDGTKLFFQKEGKGDPSFLFIHNLGGDHHVFSEQFKHFQRYGKVLTLDLRGHGQSDKPDGDYTIELFANDLAALCLGTGYRNCVVMGSSIGGNIALELGNRYPDLVSAVVLLDSGLFLETDTAKMVESYQKKILENTSEALEEILAGSCLGTDRCRTLLEKSYAKVPPHVWNSAFESLIAWDKRAKEHVLGCKTHMLYIEASSPSADRSGFADLETFASYRPQLVTGKTVGSGHYPSLEVPEQVNAMVEKFLHMKGILR